MEVDPDEAAIISAFIVSSKRGRYLSLLANHKRQPAFLDCLNHCQDIDPRYAIEVKGTADIAALLQGHGATEACHVISDCRAIDGRKMPLADALGQVEMEGWGTIISCVPGQLACYLDEAGSKRRLLLVREPGH